MRARLKDVAERAGVATNTASTILNRRSNSWASKATEARVFKAAEELGYRPSRAALGLRLGSFKTVGLVVMDLHNPFFTVFADLLERRLKDRRFDLILEHSRTDFDFEYHCLDSILERQIDGVAYFVSDLDRHLEFLKKAKKAGKAVVGLTGPSETGQVYSFDTVEMDFASGMQQAVAHLVGLGHKKFVFLCAVAKGQKPGSRPELFNQFLAKHGITPDAVSLVECGHDLQSARSSFNAFLEGCGPNRPTALIAMNDLSAIGAMRAAYDRGLLIPEDLSVIGIDCIPLGDYLYRPLSSIEQPLEALAHSTADILLERLSEEKPRFSKPKSVKYTSKFVDKGTTGPAA